MKALVGYLVGSVCYGLATAFAIRFSDRVSVSTAAALAPAVAWSGLAHVTPWPWLVAAPGIAIGMLFVRRRPFGEAATHGCLFVVTMVIIGSFRAIGLRDALTPSLIAGACYLAGDQGRQARSESGMALLPAGDRRTWWLLQAVLICACGLTAVGVQKLDWPVFAAMAGVLVLTRHEFEAFAKSRTAFEQTLRAVEKLRSREEAASSEHIRLLPE